MNIKQIIWKQKAGFVAGSGAALAILLTSWSAIGVHATPTAAALTTQQTPSKVVGHPVSDAKVAPSHSANSGSQSDGAKNAGSQSVATPAAIPANTLGQQTATRTATVISTPAATAQPAPTVVVTTPVPTPDPTVSLAGNWLGPMPGDASRCGASYSELDLEPDGEYVWVNNSDECGGFTLMGRYTASAGTLTFEQVEATCGECRQEMNYSASFSFIEANAMSIDGMTFHRQ